MMEMSNIIAVYKANIKAMFSYEPQPFAGKLTFFKAVEGNSFMAKHPELAWVPLAGGGIEIIPTTGNHANMLSQPQVEKLADAIGKQCSRRINGESRRTIPEKYSADPSHTLPELFSPTGDDETRH
jgi:thioesterase domain-containing protein